MLTAVRAIFRRTGRAVERNASFGSTLVQPAVTNCSGLHALSCNSPAACIPSGISASFSTNPRNDWLSYQKKLIQNILICKMSTESTEVTDDKKLNYEEVIDLLKKKEILLIDVRNREEVKSSGLIPGSIHIPVSELAMALKAPDDIFLSKYGFEKPKENDNIVFVCASGARSFRALRAVLHMGYKNLCTTRSYSQSAKMPGGVSPDKHLAFDDLARLIERKEIYLIDVREPHELKETGELPDSVNIPLNDLREALSVLSDKEFQKKYKARKPSFDTPVVFSCRSGARSLKALQLALELGYERAKHYKGGFLDWEAHTKKD